MAHKSLGFAHIEIRSNGITSSILIDGVDFSMKVSSITFQHRGGSLPVVRLEMPVDAVTVVGSSALRISDGSEKGTV